MEIRYGEHRAVIVIPSHGIVLKFPRMYVASCVYVLRMRVRGKSLKEALMIILTSVRWSSDFAFSPRRLLFKGFIDNWREWRFWRRTRHAILAPTILWLPWVSVQRYANPLPIRDGKELRRRFSDILGEKIHLDGHHFRNPDNFGTADGHLAVCDYASLKTQELLTEFGEELIRSFLIVP